MLWFSLLLVTILVFFSVSIACLPFLCEKNRSLATTEKRSLYDKSAKHLAVFSGTMFLALGGGLFLDYYFNGLIFQYFVQPNFLEIPFLLLGMLVILGGITFSLLLKLGKTSQKILFRCNFLIGIMILALFSVLSWLYLRSTVFFQEWSWVQLWTHEPLQILFLVYVMLCVFLGLTGAHILSLIFFIIRRNKDDYGRDYYNTVIASHVKRAIYSGLLLCIPVAVLIFVMPVNNEKLIGLSVELFNMGLLDVPLNMDSTLLNTTDFFNNIFFYISIFILLIPLSILCLQKIAKSPLPMQKKSFVFFAFQLMIIGLTVLMFRLWY